MRAVDNRRAEHADVRAGMEPLAAWARKPGREAQREARLAAIRRIAREIWGR